MIIEGDPLNKEEDSEEEKEVEKEEEEETVFTRESITNENPPNAHQAQHRPKRGGALAKNRIAERMHSSTFPITASKSEQDKIARMSVFIPGDYLSALLRTAAMPELLRSRLPTTSRTSKVTWSQMPWNQSEVAHKDCLK